VAAQVGSEMDLWHDERIEQWQEEIKGRGSSDQA
jgi:hypothetical protein